MKTILKPIFYYSVISNNIGELAIKKSIVDSIKNKLDIPIVFFNTKNDELTEDRIINQINKDASALIIAGGGLYVNQDSSSNWYFPCKTKLFEKIKVPIFLLGIGANQNIRGNLFSNNLDNNAKKSIKLINDLSTISTVRDKRTYDILAEMGVINHNLILDPACFLETQNLVNIKKEKKVAINIAQHAPILGRYDGNSEYRDKNIEIFTKVCHYLKQNNYNVLLVAFDPLEQSIIIDIKKNFPDLEYINSQNIDLIIRELAKCEFSIGMKMHSNILSFAAGTPFISVYYDVKSLEFNKLLKLEEYSVSCFEGDYYDTLINLISKIKLNCKQLSKTLNKLKINCKRKYSYCISEVCNKIEKFSNETIELYPHITVLMPVYNRESLVQESIRSVLKQTYTNFTLLIYDDGSTDKTVEKIEELMMLDNRIKLIKENINKGGLYAKQILLDSCETKYAVWMDSDDVIHSTKLEKQVEKVFFHKIVFTDWLWFENRIDWKPNKQNRDLCLDSMMFLVDKSLKFNTSFMWGSSLWFNAMIEKNPTWMVIPEKLYAIRQHPERVTLLKKEIFKLIKTGKIKEEAIRNLNYEQLKNLLGEFKKVNDN